MRGVRLNCTDLTGFARSYGFIREEFNGDEYYTAKAALQIHGLNRRVPP
jgi:hypothetical protein